MKDIFKKYSYHFVLILIGIVCIGSVYGLMDIASQTHRFPDSGNYCEAAGFFYKEFKGHYFRPLGMAIIYGIPLLFGSGDEGVFRFAVILNALLYIGSALLIFSHLKKFLKPQMAFFVSLSFYLLPGILFNSFNLLTECVFTFLILLVYYLLEKYYSKHNYKYLAWAIALLLFTMLIKPGAKFFSIVVLLFFIKALIRNYKNRHNLLLYCSVALIIFQCIKIKQEYGNFTITYIDGVTYYNYLGAKADCYKRGVDFNAKDNPRSVYLRPLPFRLQKEIAAADVASQLKYNKANLLKAYVNNLYVNTTGASGAVAICGGLSKENLYIHTVHAMFLISKCQNIFFTITGFFLAFYYFRAYKNNPFYSLISFFILYTIAVSGISSNEGDRFHIVFFPFVIILLSKFIAEKSNLKKTAI